MKTAIAIELLILAAAFFILRARGWTLERAGLQFSWKAAAAGIPIFVLYLLTYYVTATLVLMVWPGARDALTRGTTGTPFWLMLLFIVVTAFFEETIVTACVITALARHGAALAIAVSALLRFACHWYEGPPAAISVIPIGLIFGTMYWRWRNVWPLIVAHTIANLVSFAVMPQR